MRCSIGLFRSKGFSFFLACLQPQWWFLLPRTCGLTCRSTQTRQAETQIVRTGVIELSPNRATRLLGGLERSRRGSDNCVCQVSLFSFELILNQIGDRIQTRAGHG